MDSPFPQEGKIWYLRWQMLPPWTHLRPTHCQVNQQPPWLKERAPRRRQRWGLPFLPCTKEPRLNINFNLEERNTRKSLCVARELRVSTEQESDNDRRNNMFERSVSFMETYFMRWAWYSLYTKPAVANCWSSLHYLEEIKQLRKKHLIFSFITPCQSTRTQKSSSSHKLPNSTWTWALLSHKLT